jgi:putative toxin-antitoxin system antitoxin component (TIGR02293 family)
MTQATNKAKGPSVAKASDRPSKLAAKTVGRGVAVTGTTGRQRESSLAANVLKLHWQDFREVFRSAPTARIDLIRNGVPADDFKHYVAGLGVPQERVYRMLKIPTATVNRKAALHEALTPEESAKVVGMAKLIGQVETMLAESGDPAEIADFDAGKWLTDWMERPLPALGGSRPAEYMDTIEGQEMISRILAMMQSGAYA